MDMPICRNINDRRYQLLSRLVHPHISSLTVTHSDFGKSSAKIDTNNISTDSGSRGLGGCPALSSLNGLSPSRVDQSVVIDRYP